MTQTSEQVYSASAFHNYYNFNSSPHPLLTTSRHFGLGASENQTSLTSSNDTAQVNVLPVEIPHIPRQRTAILASEEEEVLSNCRSHSSVLPTLPTLPATPPRLRQASPFAVLPLGTSIQHTALRHQNRRPSPSPSRSQQCLQSHYQLQSQLQPQLQVSSAQLHNSTSLDHSRYNSVFADSPTIPQCCDSWDCAGGNDKRCAHRLRQQHHRESPVAVIRESATNIGSTIGLQQSYPSPATTAKSLQTVASQVAPSASNSAKTAWPVTPPSPLKADGDHLAFAMSELELLAVVGCVNAVCSAYREGMDLLQQIQSKRKVKKTVQLGPFPDDAMQELEHSLSRGEHIIRSQFDRDVRRFGDAFASGDRKFPRARANFGMLLLSYESCVEILDDARLIPSTEAARDALKDIIVHVQQQIISNLKLHNVQDTFVDFTALQDVSDSSQDRCILLLMQLQQRLVASGPLDSYASPPPVAVVNRHHQAGPSSSSSRSQALQSSHPSTHERYAGGLGLAMPSQRQNTGPLTPPHSPHDPPAGSFSGSSPPPNAPSRPSPPPIQPTRQPPHPNAYKSILGNPYLNQTDSLQNSPQIPLPAVPTNPDMSPYNTIFSTQPSASQYSPMQGSHQQHAVIAPLNLKTRRYSGHSNDSGPSASILSSQSSSAQDQYKPVATSSEKVGFFGIIKKSKLERMQSKTPPVKKAATLQPPPPPANLSTGIPTNTLPGFHAELQGFSQSPSIHESILTNQIVSPISMATSQDSEGAGLSPLSTYQRSVPRGTKTSFESAHSQTSSIGQHLHLSNVNNLVRSSTRQSVASVPQGYPSRNTGGPTPQHLTDGASIRSFHSIKAKDLLPNESNKFAGMCKGAWRQQIGDTKKAVEERVRPGGMYNAAKYWQCRSCKFEGRLVPLGKKQSQFDNRVFSLVNGISFRWEFLFKSHLPLTAKDAALAMSVPGAVGIPGGGDLTKNAAYACIFCVSEGRGTPTFQGVAEFMAHLVEHCEHLPAGEVLYRTNCIVGRMASPDEDFDINIVGKEGVAF